MVFKQFKSIPDFTQEGFSLVEVAVSAIIFTITTIGALALLSSTGPATGSSLQGTQAAYYAQNVLDDLRTKVDQRTWPSGIDPLALGSHSLPTVTYSGVTYNATYVVSNDTGIGPINPRKVELNIIW